MYESIIIKCMNYFNLIEPFTFFMIKILCVA